MGERIPPSERTSQAIAEPLGRGSESEHVKNELLRLAVRKIVEETLEAEVNDALGRGYYERGTRSEGGYRNGYRTGRRRSAEGAIECSAPQVSDRAEPFRSKIRGQPKGRTGALEVLAGGDVRPRTVDAGYRRGISRRGLPGRAVAHGGQ